MTLGIGVLVLQDSERIPIATWSLKQHHLDPRILGSFGCRFFYNPLPWDQLGGPALDASAVQQSVHCNIAVEWLQETKAWTKTSRVGVSIVMGLTPIAGWFMMENPSKNGWFRGTPILGNLYVEPCWCWQTYRIFWALNWGSCTLLGLDVCIGASLLWLHRTETPSGLERLGDKKHMTLMADWWQHGVPEVITCQLFLWRISVVLLSVLWGTYGMRESPQYIYMCMCMCMYMYMYVYMYVYMYAVKNP